MIHLPMRFRRVIAAIIVLTMMLPQNTPAFAKPSTPVPVTAVPPFKLEQLTIPPDLGTIVETSRDSPSNDVKGTVPSVILIQDAHAIPEAQRNIARIINHLENQSAVGLVAVEGAPQGKPLDPFLLKSFPDKKRLKEILGHYFSSAEISGATAAAILSEGDTQYAGVEDWEIYQQGIEHYLKARDWQPELLEWSKKEKGALDQQKSKLYSQELLDLERQVEAFYENHSGLLELLTKLHSLAPSVKPEPDLALLL